MKKYLVFDFGGTFIKYALMNENGEILEKSKFPSQRDKHTLETFMSEIQHVYLNYKEQISGIAISSPGLVDADSGMIYIGGALGKFLADVNLIEVVRKTCDNIPVSVENDGKCAGLAEIWKGSAKDKDSAITIAFGTGIAGSVVWNKHVHHGKHLIAGEFSSLLLDGDYQNCEVINFSTRCATSSMVKKAAQVLNLPLEEMSGEILFEKASQGDMAMQDILNETYYHTAIQILNIQTIYDPDVFLIGGGISEQPCVIEGINRYIQEIHAQSPRLVIPVVRACTFKNDANLLGALYHHLAQFEN